MFKKKIPALFPLYSFTSNIVVIKQKRKSPPIKENIMIVSIIYLIGVVIGFLIDLIGVTLWKQDYL